MMDVVETPDTENVAVCGGGGGGGASDAMTTGEPQPLARTSPAKKCPFAVANMHVCCCGRNGPGATVHVKLACALATAATAAAATQASPERRVMTATVHVMQRATA